MQSNEMSLGFVNSHDPASVGLVTNALYSIDALLYPCLHVWRMSRPVEYSSPEFVYLCQVSSVHFKSAVRLHARCCFVQDLSVTTFFKRPHFSHSVGSEPESLLDKSSMEYEGIRYLH
jgi:hypothetical protein